MSAKEAKETKAVAESKGKDEIQNEIPRYIVEDVKLSWSKYPELLLPVKDEDEMCDNLQDVISSAFDIPDELVSEMYNRDIMWVPTEIDYKDECLNSYQATRFDSCERDPIMSAFTYLFLGEDYIYGEPYDYSGKERKLLDEFYKKIVAKYKSPADYITRVLYALYTPPAQIDIIRKIHLEIVQKAWQKVK